MSQRFLHLAIVSICFLAATSRYALSEETKDMLTPLSDAEIRTLLKGNTLVSDGAKRGEESFWAVYYLNLRQERGESGSSRDSGRWRAEGGALCSHWNTWGNGEKCFPLFRDSRGRIVAYFEGKHSFNALVVKGNSLGL
ncbi:hypothetical protein HBA55_13670 [Pseudomaricurvus alkylphenolicus]|uniref:hypothetical protein n=1 Tax=Pseudomaricurvus alkylphenolicus TaxID=1306991 RepID=UPI00141E486A|nr:hypothetical protein [Pseudomaricurvus alkylphenolicus]NIB40645.1 hypothetical protein [Pseudomaricurvus alkylphenolicus]